MLSLASSNICKNDLLLNENQHGIMHRKSCETYLIENLDILTDALNNGKIVDVVYTDFSKTFDKVDHDLLLLKTEAYGFSGYILKWIKDFLNEWEQRVILGNSCSE